MLLRRPLKVIGLVGLVVPSLASAQAAPRGKGRSSTAVPSGASAGAASASSASDTAAVHAVVHAYAASLVGAPPNPDRTASLYARDGEMLPPGGPAVVGPDSVRALLAGFSKFVVEAAEMIPQSTTVMGSHAISWGDYTQRAVPPGQPAVNVGGRYVMELVKQADGRWLVRRLLVQPR
ncbi:MAG: nuclear transport factor 2 family protein [Gemmatimonadetes bacterium]|nr:nuclear transport factor 2 family protein [Gemmatimonadota bacterium]